MSKRKGDFVFGITNLLDRVNKRCRNIGGSILNSRRIFNLKSLEQCGGLFSIVDLKR